jgi:cation diffusion facilitator CzcD-associated flavoprotein CzcO
MLAPSHPDHEVIVVGTGFAGLGMAIKLQEAGVDFLVLEQADSIGGTWRENTYPGCACDVQSHLYSYSFAPNAEWTRMFAPQPEIRSYLERCADDYGVRTKIRLGAALTHAEWDEIAGLWRVQVNGEETLTARVLVPALGALSRPTYPDIPGRHTFAGTAFHSAEWDHDYDFAGKRVAVIGTGASAIQFVPQIAKGAASVDLYQRTPPWIIPKPDRPISRFERWLFRRVPTAQRLYRNAIYWALESRVLGFVLHPRLMKGLELYAKHHIRRQISDPELRRKITPDYTIGCKRILISDDYYRTLDQAHVDVITDDVAEITEHGVVTADGVERPVDAIVYGTGFRVQDLLTPLTVIGRDGADLNETWREAGMQAFKGTAVAGFPNLFLLLGPNTGLGHSSMVFMAECQIRYVTEALRAMREQRLGSVAVRPEAQAAYNGEIQGKLTDTVWSQGGCRSWYLDARGRNTTLWPGFTFAFRRATQDFDTESYELAPRTAPVPAVPVA